MTAGLRRVTLACLVVVLTGKPRAAELCEVGQRGSDSLVAYRRCTTAGAGVVYGGCPPFRFDKLGPPELEPLARLVVRIGQIEDDHQALISRIPSDPHGRGLCESQLLAYETPLGFCTGFVVTPDTIVTAAHCLYVDGKLLPAEDMVITTDPGVEPAREAVGVTYVSLPRQGASATPLDDVAVLRVPAGTFPEGLLTHAGVTGTARMLDVGTQVFSLGFPLATALRFTSPGAIVAAPPGEVGLYGVGLSVLRGNSGSPVFADAPGQPFELVGMLQGGVTDFDEGDRCLCHRAADDGDTEVVVPMHRILEELGG